MRGAYHRRVYEHILIPTDGSVGTAHVAMQAIDLAQQYDSTLHVFHVIDDGGLVSGEESSIDDERREHGENAVRRVEQIAGVHGVDVETAVRTGDPAESILAYADEVGADLIVAGTHGRSGLRRRVIGSVAERLVRHADCPVMTVRLPESDVTVHDESQARAIVADRLADRGIDAESTAVERQVNVWVAEADADDESLVVYLDPVSRRTSVVERHGEE